MRFTNWVKAFVLSATVTLGTIIFVGFDCSLITTYIYAEVSMLSNFYIFSKCFESK